MKEELTKPSFDIGNILNMVGAFLDLVRILMFFSVGNHIVD